MARTWLESDDESDSDTELDARQERQELGVDHRPRQSRFFYEHQAEIDEALELYGYVMLAQVSVLIFLSLWLRIERGQFPFNTEPFASVAYSRYTRGNAVVVLLAVFVVAFGLYRARSAIFGTTQELVVGTAEELMRAAGQTRKVAPKKPLELRRKRQSGRAAGASGSAPAAAAANIGAQASRSGAAVASSSKERGSGASGA